MEVQELRSLASNGTLTTGGGEICVFTTTRTFALTHDAGDFPGLGIPKKWIVRPNL